MPPPSRREAGRHRTGPGWQRSSRQCRRRSSGPMRFRPCRLSPLVVVAAPGLRRGRPTHPEVPRRCRRASHGPQARPCPRSAPDRRGARRCNSRGGHRDHPECLRATHGEIMAQSCASSWRLWRPPLCLLGGRTRQFPPDGVGASWLELLVHFELNTAAFSPFRALGAGGFRELQTAEAGRKEGKGEEERKTRPAQKAGGRTRD